MRLQKRFLVLDGLWGKCCRLQMVGGPLETIGSSRNRTDRHLAGGGYAPSLPIQAHPCLPPRRARLKKSIGPLSPHEIMSLHPTSGEWLHGAHRNGGVTHASRQQMCPHSPLDATFPVRISQFAVRTSLQTCGICCLAPDRACTMQQPQRSITVGVNGGACFVEEAQNG